MHEELLVLFDEKLLGPILYCFFLHDDFGLWVFDWKVKTHAALLVAFVGLVVQELLNDEADDDDWVLFPISVCEKRYLNFMERE